MATQRERAATVLQRCGTTYAKEAGFRLADKPSPLYKLSVLAVLLSARIDSSIAVAAARELFGAGFTTPAKMAAATWQQRVDALGRGHYRRYDERTSTMLGDGAELIRERWRGDLRRLRGDDLRAGLQAIPGIGGAGADIFTREVQEVWPELRPFVDDRAQRGARAVGLPTTGRELQRLVDEQDFTRLVAGLVRLSLEKEPERVVPR